MKTISKEEIRELGHYNDVLEFLYLCNINPIFIKDDNNVIRFKGNKIMRYLIDYHREETHKVNNSHNQGLNIIWSESCVKNYTLREFVELYIGIGYSLCGFVEVFGDYMSLVFREKHDYYTGKIVEVLGPNEESITLIEQNITSLNVDDTITNCSEGELD
jgi:hypothetical protein